MPGLPHDRSGPGPDRGSNAAAAKLLSATRQGLKGTCFSRLFPGQTPGLIDFSQTVLSLGRCWTRGIQPIGVHGERLNVELRGERVERTDGVELLLFAILDLVERERHATDAFEDRSTETGTAEHQRVERLFRDIENQNKLILNAAGEGIYGVNADGITTFVESCSRSNLRLAGRGTRRT